MAKSSGEELSPIAESLPLLELPYSAADFLRVVISYFYVKCSNLIRLRFTTLKLNEGRNFEFSFRNNLIHKFPFPLEV